MREQEIAAYAQSLGIDLPRRTEDSLRSAIQSELKTLQGGTLSPDQTERRRVLTDELVQLRDGDEKKPSTELVPISPNAIAEIVKAAVMAQNPGLSAEDKMRTGVHVTATQAKKDFRNERTWPFAGLGAVVAFVWSQRDALGVDLTGVGSAWWAAGALTTLLMALCWYMLAYRAQRSDERRLRRLYSPSTQGRALRRMFDPPTFTLDKYRFALWRASCEEHEYVTPDGHPVDLPRAPQRFRHRTLVSMLSAVDVESAVEDASMLALERFVRLGVIEPVESMIGAEYRLTAKYRAGHGIVSPEGETADADPSL